MVFNLGRMGLACAIAVISLVCLPASAQATRTWVSGVGDDVNPCSRTAPCKTFAGAISKTAAGGIINCLDPAGYGAVTITKSMTIDCSGTMAGVLVPGTNGIIINAAPTDIVALRGLSIEGTGTGLVGVSHLAGGTLHVESCRIMGFRGGSATGIRFTPSSAGSLYVSDTTIVDSGTGATGGGIVIRPTGTGGAKATLRRVQLSNNADGLVADSSGGSGLVRVQVVDSLFAGSARTGIIALTSVGGGPSSSVFVDRATVVHNGTGGLLSNGGSAQIVLGGSTIADNSMVGVSSINGGIIYTYWTNNINANLGPDGTPIPNPLPGN